MVLGTSSATVRCSLEPPSIGGKITPQSGAPSRKQSLKSQRTSRIGVNTRPPLVLQRLKAPLNFLCTTASDFVATTPFNSHTLRATLSFDVFAFFLHGSKFDVRCSMFDVLALCPGGSFRVHPRFDVFAFSLNSCNTSGK